jgi:hypothetical protein
MITIYTKDEILTDLELYCKYYHKGNVKYSKATKLSSKSLSCELNASNMSLTTEMIQFGIGVNQSSTRFIDLNTVNITYVFLREPISYSGVTEIVTKLNYNSNFSIDILDARKSFSVSFSNYSVILSPDFHDSFSLNCSFDKASPICSFPQLSFNYFPLRLNLNLIVISREFQDKISFKINELYHTESVTILQDFPYLLDLESYTNNPVSITFNSSKILNPNFSFYCKCNSYFSLKIDGNISSKVTIPIQSKFKCDVFSNLDYPFLNVSLWVNDIKLGGISSIEDSRISFNSIQNLFHQRNQFQSKIL